MSAYDLPDTTLITNEQISANFIAHGCKTFRGAALYLRDLPYGRNLGTPAHLSVLNEGRGTCSSKHALVVALAHELDLDVRLVLGIYEMDETNTPGVGPTLTAAGLRAVPEAHCWITYGLNPIDLTSPNAQSQFHTRTFVHEEEIEPEQTGSYKAKAHRDFITRWLSDAQHVNLNSEQVWRIREECIAALSV